MTIGDRIKKRRLELGLSQEELAFKLGYKSRSSINKLECSRNLPLTKVEKMATALECTPSYLMGWDDEEDGENVVVPITEKKPGIKIIKRDGTSQEFDINSVIYAVTESLMRMSPEEQRLVHKMVARDDDDNTSNKKKNVIYVSNPQYAKIRKDSLKKKAPYETAKQVKKYGGAVAFLKKNGNSLVTSIINTITLDVLETLNLSTENIKLLKKIIANKGYDNFNDIEAKRFLSDFVLPVAYKDIVFNNAFLEDVYHQCHYITSLLTPSQRTKCFYDSVALDAAHERTDVEVTDEMKQHDDDFFDEED